MNIRLMLVFIVTQFPFYVNANILTNGVYYSKWVYSENNMEKVYPILSNKFNRDKNGVYLLPDNASIIGDEIYLRVSDDTVNIYYRQVNNDGGVVTIGRGDVDILDGVFSIKNNISNTFFDGKVPPGKLYINYDFSGRDTSPAQKEIIPFKVERPDAFSVDCKKYLKINGYYENGLPDYTEDDISYNTNIFATDSGICGLLLNDDNVRQIKEGRILFEKFNETSAS